MKRTEFFAKQLLCRIGMRAKSHQRDTRYGKANKRISQIFRNWWLIGWSEKLFTTSMIDIIWTDSVG